MSEADGLLNSDVVRGKARGTGHIIIWYISKYATPRQYGLATRTFFLAREFARIGCRTIMISSDSNHLGRFPKFGKTYNRELIEGVEVWWLQTLKYRRTASVLRVLSWFDFELKLLFMPKAELGRPDVVIISSLSLLTILNGWLLKLRYRCRLVFEIRDIWPLTMVEEGGYSPSHPFVRFLAWVERFGYRKADIIVGTMPNLVEHVRSVTRQDRPCACIPFGYDPEHLVRCQPLSQEYTDRYIPKGKIVVGYAGSMGLTNALDTLIECSKTMVADTDVHFFLVGDGDLRQHYQERVAGQGNITFAPKVNKEQVSAVLDKCDMLYFAVHNSTVWRFGQSLNKVIDYMMSGKPIVASYGGYESMINEAQCGTFLPAADVSALVSAIRKYAAMPAVERAAVGARGKAWILKNRSYDVLAREYLALCGQLTPEN